MLEVIQGDWPSGLRAICVSTFRPHPIDIIFQSGLKQERVLLSQVSHTELIASDNSAANAVGYTLVGAALFGVLGALAGADAAKRAQKTMIAVTFKDGRKVVLSGPVGELAPILAVGHKWTGTDVPSEAGGPIPDHIIEPDEWDKRIEQMKAEKLEASEKPRFATPSISPARRSSPAFGQRKN